MAKVTNKSVLSIPISFEKVSEVGIDDERFTRVKIWLMHTGENYNGSIFEKSVIEKALPTLGYIPIVGFIEVVEDSIQNEKDFSDHRYIITKDEKGIRRKYIGSGYGVVLSNGDNNAHFEMRMCDDGIEREFLVVDGICWNMFEDSSDILKRDIVKSHSMELHEPSVEGFEDENEKFHFTNFSFRAACILGNGCEPAMHNSTIEVQFTISDFMRTIQSELNDKYTAFTKIVNANNKGGNTAMPNTAMSKNNEDTKTDFALSLMQQFDNIATIVNEQETIVDRWGDTISRYSLVDIQDNEIIVVDRSNDYNYYGFSFTVNGDAPTIDFSNAVRKKVVYENYEDGATTSENAFDFGKEIDEIETKAFSKVESANQTAADAKKAQETAETNYSQMKEKYNQVNTDYKAVKSDYDEIKPKYDEYVKTEQARLDAEVESAKDAQFTKFEPILGEDAEFVKLKENKANYSVKEIEDGCYIMYAKKIMATNFSKPIGETMTAGLMDDGQDDNVGFVSTIYGNIPVKK